LATPNLVTTLTDVYLEFTLQGMSQMAKAAKAGDKDTVAQDLTTVVTATSVKWMEKANGTTDANKF
jgi:hypothetical protein